MFADFVSFYNQYIQKEPNASLSDIVRKFVVGRSVGAHFGWTMNLESNELRRMPVFHSYSETCSVFVGNDKKRHLFLVEKPDDLSAQQLEQLIMLNKLYMDAELVNSAPAGTYTYMIGSTANGVPHIYALRAFTHHEIGTKHCRILERVTSDQFGPDRMQVLHFAGEVYIQVSPKQPQRRSISINVSSGTYMAGNTDDALKSTYLSEMSTFLQKFVSSPNNIEIKFGPNSLFPSDMITPREAIWLYLIAGMRLLVFRSSQECSRYTNRVRSAEQQEPVQPKRVITSDQDELIRPVVVVKPKPKLTLRKVPRRKPIAIVVKRNLRQAQPYKLAKIELVGSEVCPVVPVVHHIPVSVPVPNEPVPVPNEPVPVPNEPVPVPNEPVPVPNEPVPVPNEPVPVPNEPVPVPNEAVQFGKWSLKYKRSIDCGHPRGFSQKQYCKYKRR